MSLLVAVSDLHLDQSTAGVDRFEDVVAVLEKAAAYAIEKQADAFLFLGDLADPNTVRSHRSVNALARVMSKLKQKCIQCVCLAGNHDVIEDGSGGTVLDSLVWLDAGPVYTEPTVEPLLTAYGEFICTIVALPFVPIVRAYNPEEFIRNIGKKVRIQDPVLVIGHLNLDGITLGSESTDMPRGRDIFWPLDDLRIQLPNALRVGGHYHTPQTFEGVRIIGSAVRLRFDERDNDPGFVVLEV
jgi:DNA repair exonuclease SbcCD nuclease subunit